MTVSNENIDPRSLPNLSNLLTNSAHKRNNKHKANKGSPQPSGLKDSFLHNLTIEHHNVPTDTLDSGTQLPTPPSSQSMQVSLDRPVEETRLPISPPPEEEIRIKELTAHGHTPKQPQSRLPVRSRLGAFKFPGPPQSFANFQQTRQAPGEGPVSDAADASNLNPRKRSRSVIPPPPAVGSSASSPTEQTSAAPSNTVAPSPNPKPRKQPKRHETGVYTGSGFKRRHKRGTSAESLDGADGEQAISSLSFKSPARKKRQDPGAEDYTPQREHTLASTSQASPTKRKARARRSATPDVRYEPPTEQFTPPREVILQIPSSTASSRSRKAKPSSSASVISGSDRKVVKVKVERLTSPLPLPALDLSKPAPPPSPTDDPLLLVGLPLLVRRSVTPSVVVNKTLVDASVGVDQPATECRQQEPSTPIRASPNSVRDVNQSLWNFDANPEEETALMGIAFDGPSTFDATFDPDSDSDSGGAIDDDADAVFNHPSPGTGPGVFDPNQSTGSHIFHSDDEEAEAAADAGEDEGEYTGRFKFYSVPVKQDPPSSATKARRESWGKPISPFPYARRQSRPPSPEEEVRDEKARPDEDSPPPSPSEGRRMSGTPSAYKAHVEVPRTRGFTLSEMEARLEDRLAQRANDSVGQAEASLVDADQEDVTVRIQNGESHPDQEDDEELGSVEREITPIDDDEDVGSDTEDQALPASEDEQEGSVDDAEASQDLEEQEPGANTSGQQGTHDDENEEENVDHKHDTLGANTSTSIAVSAAHSLRTRYETSLSSSRPSCFTEHYVALRKDDDGNELETLQAYDDDDDNSPPPGVVEVSSDDPKAAARAAAILKLHHSYIVDGLVAKRERRRTSHAFSRRASFAFGEENIDGDQDGDIIRRARRKSMVTSAGVMQHRPRQIAHSPLAQSAFIAPASPARSAISAEEALRKAEIEIRAASASPSRPGTPLRPVSLVTESVRSRFVTPSPLVGISHLDSEEPQQLTGNGKEWTKAHWKMLDTCFTDERLAVGSSMGLGTQMADVDDVEIEAVVRRFLAGLEDSEEWDHDMLIRRATALSTRQRAGHGAPPSPGRILSRTLASELVVPVFTPPVVQRTFIPPIEVEAPARLPPSLLAPRYAHLHEEATASTSTPSVPASSPRSEMSETETSESQDQVAILPHEPAQPSTPQPSHPAGKSYRSDGAAPIPASATKRVLSYLGSFLGRNGTNAPSKPALKPVFGALPLPPPEMRQVVRGPVNTPAKKPLPKSQPPRELVHLTETQLPDKPSEFPKAKSAREMVNLNHVDPPRSVQRPRTASGPITIPGRTRKDSGDSVKDLVRSFEEVRKKTEEEMRKSKEKHTVRKVASVGSLKARAMWKP